MTTSLEPPTMSLRERNKLQTRTTILSCFFLLVDRDGVSGTSMSEVARLAGVSEATLYNYFRTKDDLVEALADSSVGEETLVSDIRARPKAEGPFEALRAALDDIASYSAHEVNERKRVTGQIRADDQLFGSFLRVQRREADLLAQALRERAPLWSDMTAAVVAAAVNGVLRASLEALPANRSGASWAKLLDTHLSRLELAYPVSLRG